MLKPWRRRRFDELAVLLGVLLLALVGAAAIELGWLDQDPLRGAGEAVRHVSPQRELRR